MAGDGIFDLRSGEFFRAAILCSLGDFAGDVLGEDAPDLGFGGEPFNLSCCAADGSSKIRCPIRDGDCCCRVGVRRAGDFAGDSFGVDGLTRLRIGNRDFPSSPSFEADFSFATLVDALGAGDLIRSRGRLILVSCLFGLLTLLLKVALEDRFCFRRNVKYFVSHLTS